MRQLAQGRFGGSRRFFDTPPVQDWASLQPGERVEVWSVNSFCYTAYVDDRADDGQLIWVIENGTGSRRLFIPDDPVELYSV